MEKYEEKVEQLKRMLPSWEKLSYNGKTFIQDLKNIFTELAESEDEKIRKEIISHFTETIDNIRSEEIIPHDAKVLVSKMQKWIAWLKLLKDRIAPQPKQEWSEKDEQMYEAVMYDLEKLKGDSSFPISSNAYEWLKDRFKSLRPQPHWKPSDAQMTSITCAVRKMKESACYDSELVSLFNDLKKL